MRFHSHLPKSRCRGLSPTRSSCLQANSQDSSPPCTKKTTNGKINSNCNFILHSDHPLRKQKSVERQKKWPNTINAYRKNKDAFRFERFKVDEEKRRQIEIEEAEY